MADVVATMQLDRRSGGENFTLDVTLTARPGITCILGRSGSGKSTVLGAIAGLTRPDSGRIVLGSEVWFDPRARINVPTQRRGIAYVFQSLALFPHFDALNNVTYGMSRTLPRAQRREQGHALLQKLGVAHLAGRKPRTFSGGEAQRVALARALATHPRVVLLDEPFSALDRDLRIQLAGVVRTLVDELQIPLIHVTHNLGEARALADLVIRMQGGRIIESGTPDELLARRHDEASANESSARIRPGTDLEGPPLPTLVRR